ncbi:hypothetical protein OROMI_011500 [Orobanche minor]
MGFDIECIIDIHTYPGEYFCPVCRTLVYPNEAFQSQCTHLYCKPCLAHIANGSKACPYDGYLVTESDSKPLMVSDKALGENIGKVKVHCLYFRSGCTWEGTLSDCTSHCSGCSFGNSPVICNRCGIQIVHSQVHDHAQSCPMRFESQGVYEGQHAVGGVSSLTRSGIISSTTEANQAAAAQSGAPPSQDHNPQAVAATPLPGQNPNLQVSDAASQAAVVAPVGAPTPEQWYQQQYQQFYQQYDPYQQANQQYYHLQQQYQQHPMQVQGQQQSNPAPQATQQPHIPQDQVQAHSQMQLLPHAQPQVPVPPQGPSQVHAPNHALAPNYQVDLQQQAYPSMRPSQTLPPHPQSQPAQPPTYAQAMGMRPSAQHPQVPQYQQPHVQMMHPQPTQAHVLPQMPSQAQPPQSSNQLHMQIQTQPQPYHTQSQPPVFPQANQSVPATLPQGPQQQVPPGNGHPSYLHPQPPQQMHQGAPQTHLVHQQIAIGSLHPGQVHGQVPQQRALMQPPTHGSVPYQHPSTLLAPQNQTSGIPSAPQNQFQPRAPQPAYPHQHRPVVPPAQQALPQNYAQQQQFLAPYQSQLHQQGHLTQQQSMQRHMHPPGPPPAQQSQNFVGRPMVPNQGIYSQNHPFTSGNFGAPAHSGPAQPTPAQTSVNQNYAKPTVLEQNATVQQTRSPSKGLVEKIGEPLNEEPVVAGQNGTVVKDADSDASVNKSIIKQDEDRVQGAKEQASGGKPFEDGATEDELRKEGKLLAEFDSMKQVDLDNRNMEFSKTVVTGPSSTNFDKQPHSTVYTSGAEAHILPPHSHGFHQQMPQAPGPPPSMRQPQGPGISHHPLSLNSAEEWVPGYFGPPKNFESQSDPQGPGLTTLADPRGIIGRAPPLSFEGRYGPQNVSKPSEVTMSNHQMPSSAHLSGSGEGGPFSETHANQPSSFRMNGLTAADSSVSGSRDEKKAISNELLNPFPREPAHNIDQASRFLDKAAPHGPIHDAASMVDPAAMGPESRFFPHHPSAHGHADALGPGPEFGRHMKQFSRRSSDRDYLGSSPHGFGGPSSFPRGTSDDIKSREAHRFIDGPQSFNIRSDPSGNPLHDDSFPIMSDHLRRGDLDGPRNPRFGEHIVPGPHHNQFGSGDLFGPDGPGHLMRGQFSGHGYLPGHFHMIEPAGPGAFSGRGHAGEFGGLGNFPRLPLIESVRGNRSSFSHFGEPRMMNNYSHPVFQPAANFPGGIGSFDQSRKRKPISYGWCRICDMDCESVEGLDFHSQTREHQKMAMDIVKRIKLQNKKQHRTLAGHMVNEGGNRSRKVTVVGRGSKP